MGLKKYILGYLIFSACFSFDTWGFSLDSILSLQISDSTKARKIFTHFKTHKNLNLAQQQALLTQCISLLKEKNHPSELFAGIYKQMALLKLKEGNYQRTLYYFEKEKALRLRLENIVKLGHVYNNLGVTYAHSGLYNEALDNQLKALKIKEKTQDFAGLAGCYHNIALVYDYQKKYSKAISNYKKSLSIKLKVGDQYPIANTYTNLGIIYANLNEFSKGIDYLNRAKDLYLDLPDSLNLCIVYSNLAWIDVKRKDHLSYVDNITEALQINKVIESTGMKASIASVMAEHFEITNKKDSALFYYQKAALLFKETGSSEDLLRCYKHISKIHQNNNNFKQAYAYTQKFITTKDSLDQKQNQLMLTNAQEKYESEQKQQEIEIKNLELEKAKTLHYFFLIIGLIFSILLLTLGLSLYSRMKNNKILEHKNQIISGQKNAIEKQQKNVIESVQYAQKIQRSFFSTEEQLKAHFSDSFIFHKPKEMLSGDFFWLSKVQNKYIFAAVDCTGHGIPGAMMSILGNRLLNEIVNIQNILDPGKIIEKLHTGIVNDLKQTSDQNSQDGMDLFLCIHDPIEKTLKYSGARNKAFLIEKNKLISLNTTLKSVGGKRKNETSTYRKFETHKLTLNPKTKLYMFTDGITDQFGGPDRKKLGSKQFKTLLMDNHMHSFDSQKKNIIQYIKLWQSNHEQIDDMLLIGIQFT